MSEDYTILVALAKLSATMNCNAWVTTGLKNIWKKKQNSRHSNRLEAFHNGQPIYLSTQLNL